MNILVIGGTAFIGPRIVAQLDALGHKVTVFHRGRTGGDLPPDVEHLLCPSCLMGDRSHLYDFRNQFRECAPEVVLDMIPVTEQDAEITVEIFRPLAQRLVAVSSQDVYRAYGILLGLEGDAVQEVPIAEEGDLRTHHHPYRGSEPRSADDPHRWMDDYEKILVERVVMQAEELAGTVLRFPMVYGPRDRQHRTWEYLQRMDEDRPAIVLAESLAAWRWTRGYVENIAAAAVAAITDPRAAGRIYNLGDSEALTTEAWVAAIAQAAGWGGRIVRVPDAELPEPLRPGMQTAQHLVADTQRIRAELDFTEPTPRAEALAATIAWERDHPPEKISDLSATYALEDEVLAQH